MVVWAHYSSRARVPRKNARQTRVRVPARETNKYTATYAVPRSLGGQDSRFSLSQLCVAHKFHAHTLIFFARKHPHWASLILGSTPSLRPTPSARMV